MQPRRRRWPALDWRIAVIALFVAWGLQAVLAWQQAQSYRQALRETAARRASGYLGVGAAARRFGRGAVVILVADPDGTILEGRKMVGATVFARFEPYDRFNGMTVAQVGAALVPPAGQRRTALDEAAAGALAQIEARLRRPLQTGTDGTAVAGG